MAEQKTNFTFPCTFPIKIIGLPNVGLEEFVKGTLEEHVEEPTSIDIKVRESSNGNYISVTATFTAHSKEQLDKIYRKMTAHKHVKMVL